MLGLLANHKIYCINLTVTIMPKQLPSILCSIKTQKQEKGGKENWRRETRD